MLKKIVFIMLTKLKLVNPHNNTWITKFSLPSKPNKYYLHDRHIGIPCTVKGFGKSIKGKRRKRFRPSKKHLVRCMPEKEPNNQKITKPKTTSG